MKSNRFAKSILYLLLLVLPFIGFNSFTSVNANAIYLIPGGESVGLELRSDGLIITGTYDVQSKDGVYNPYNDNFIKGDMIVEANGKSTKTLVDFINVLSVVEDSKPNVDVTITRNGSKLNRLLKLVKVNSFGSWKTGLYVKEKLLGVGTVTFYNPANNTFGSLGHEMFDNDMNRIFEVSNGSLYDSTVIGIRKSTNGNPGEKISRIDETKKIGNIIKNNNYGVYGKINSINSNKQPLLVGSRSQVRTGKAEIYTVVEGNKVETFSIEITSVRNQSVKSTKGFSFKVNDQALLNKTNGIVQGMSGSPVIQDNKIIGAVTHVLVDSVQQGHGLYIEWMLDNANYY